MWRKEIEDFSVFEACRVSLTSVEWKIEKSRTAIEICGVTRVLKSGEFWLKMRIFDLKNEKSEGVLEI